MINNKTFLAIIPARGGSKRLPKKNVLNLAGKPLIAWSIESGLYSKYIDDVMVTTDDEEIIKVSKQYGANVPFKRPSFLSTDTASRADVVLHAIEFYKNELKKEFDYIVYLQPTSPLRTNFDIDNAIVFLININADAVISLCPVDHPLQWTGLLPSDNNMENFISNIDLKTRSQDLEPYYRLNGAIYICKTKKFLEQGDFYLKNNIFAYLMSKESSVDIDDEYDFNLAEYLLIKKNI